MKSNDSGSAFIEALVASAIVAMAMMTMLQSTAQSASRERAVESRRLAMLVAQSQLATVGTLIPISPGETNGSDGEFVWRVSISPYGEGNGLLLVDVSVRAGSESRPLVDSQSLMLATQSGSS